MCWIGVDAISRPMKHRYLQTKIGKKRESSRGSMQYRGSTGAGLAQGKNRAG